MQNPRFQETWEGIDTVDYQLYIKSFFVAHTHHVQQSVPAREWGTWTLRVDVHGTNNGEHHEQICNRQMSLEISIKGIIC